MPAEKYQLWFKQIRNNSMKNKTLGNLFINFISAIFMTYTHAHVHPTWKFKSQDRYTLILNDSMSLSGPRAGFTKVCEWKMIMGKQCEWKWFSKHPLFTFGLNYQQKLRLRSKDSSSYSSPETPKKYRLPPIIDNCDTSEWWKSFPSLEKFVLVVSLDKMIFSWVYAFLSRTLFMLYFK